MVVVDIYRATVEGTWAEAASAVGATASGLVTMITVVGAIVLVIAITLIAVRSLVGDELDLTKRIVVVIRHRNTADHQGEEDNSQTNS